MNILTQCDTVHSIGIFTVTVEQLTFIQRVKYDVVVPFRPGAVFLKSFITFMSIHSIKI